MAKKPYHMAAPVQPNVFTSILKQAVDQGVIGSRTEAGRQWFRDTASKVANVNNQELLASDPTRFRQSVVPGRMYMFNYDPKLKLTLPYYDLFPVIFPLEMKEDGFLGLNFHYLPPVYRAKLMDTLYTLANNNRYDETTKIQLSYKICKMVSTNNYYKPCVKRYLKSNVRSRFVSIASSEWDAAIFLPTQRFQKQTATQVWADSVRKINRGR